MDIASFGISIMTRIKTTEKASDWDSIYNQMFQKRAVERFNYDCTHGIGAFDRREKEQLEELHQFFVEFEQKNCNNKLPVIFIN